MTAATLPRTTAPHDATRILNVARLHLVNKSTYIGIPWIIIGGAWVVSMVIALLIRYATDGGVPEGMGYSWAVLSPLWYMTAVGILTISSTFPFALGFSVTRREFYLGTSLLFVVLSLANSIALATLVEAEKATNGWGIGTIMFSALWFGTESWIVNMFSFLVIQLGILFIGAAIATIYMRWRVKGQLILWLSIAALIVAAITIITLTSSWVAIGELLAAQSIASLFGWLMIPVALSGFFGYFILRGATPKN